MACILGAVAILRTSRESRRTNSAQLYNPTHIPSRVLIFIPRMSTQRLKRSLERLQSQLQDVQSKLHDVILQLDDEENPKPRRSNRKTDKAATKTANVSKTKAKGKTTQNHTRRKGCAGCGSLEHKVNHKVCPNYPKYKRPVA